jgi:hypothetical protein
MFCGVRIKRDSLNFQFKGFGAVPKLRSKNLGIVPQMKFSI